MFIEKKSTLSGEYNVMDLPITQEQLTRYYNGEDLIQNIFPDLLPEQREFLMTGITPKEWYDIFGNGNNNES